MMAWLRQWLSPTKPEAPNHRKAIDFDRELIAAQQRDVIDLQNRLLRAEQRIARQRQVPQESHEHDE